MLSRFVSVLTIYIYVDCCPAKKNTYAHASALDIAELVGTVIG